MIFESKKPLLSNSTIFLGKLFDCSLYWEVLWNIWYLFLVFLWGSWNIVDRNSYYNSFFKRWKVLRHHPSPSPKLTGLCQTFVWEGSFFSFMYSASLLFWVCLYISSGREHCSRHGVSTKSCQFDVQQNDYFHDYYFKHKIECALSFHFVIVSHLLCIPL